MRGLTFLNTFRAPRDAWLLARQTRVLALLTALEIRVLGAHLFERASHYAIAKDEGLHPLDVETICVSAIGKLEQGGFVVQRPHVPQLTFKPEISYVPNEELDRRPAA